MRKVWKYQLIGQEETCIELPINSKVLSCQVQHGRICLWVEIDEEQIGNPCKRTFHIFGTDQPIPDGFEYVGTVQEREGYLIWHIYELKS